MSRFRTRVLEMLLITGMVAFGGVIVFVLSLYWLMSVGIIVGP